MITLSNQQIGSQYRQLGAAGINTCKIVSAFSFQRQILAAAESTRLPRPAFAEQAGEAAAKIQAFCGIVREENRRSECASCPAWCCVDYEKFYAGVGVDGDTRSVRVPRAIIPGYGLPEQDAQSNALPRGAGSEPARQQTQSDCGVRA